MKRILSVLAIGVAVVCISFDASAQDSARRGGGMGGPRRSPEERAKMQTEQMVKSLSLTPEQTVKIDSLNLQFAKTGMGGMRGGNGGGGNGADNGDRMAAMKKMQDDKNAAYKPILTEKQYADYLKMVDEQNKKMMERMQQPRNGQ